MKNLRKKSSSKGGFTLIEILVVMAIIGILLATAIPAIVGQIQKQKEAASAAKAHNLAIACFSYANDNNQVYPYGSTSAVAFNALYAGKYLLQPTEVYLTSVNGVSPYSGSEAQTVTLLDNNVSWDYVVNGTSGLTSSAPSDLPLVFSDITATHTFAAGNNTVPIKSTCVWGTDGVTVCTLAQQASFIRPYSAGNVYLTPPPVAGATSSFDPGSSTYSSVLP